MTRALYIFAAMWWGLMLPAHAAEPADTILLNGKVVTLDDRFAVFQGVAIRGERIVAVGNNADVLELQGRGTKVIDLKKQTVIPGLIDNHAHFIRAPEHQEMRLDGVASRRQALAMLAERLRAALPGEWIVTLGGWSEEQFTDDPRGFALEELDRIAPANPVVLQAVYNQSYLNSAALKAAGIDAATPDPRGGRIEKDASGNPTGVVRLGRVRVSAGDDQAAAQRFRRQAGGDARSAPHRAGDRRGRHVPERPRGDGKRDRCLSRRVRSDQQGRADQGLALGVLASRSSDRRAARAHEAARHVRGAAQPAAHPGRADAQGARRARVGHASLQTRAGKRHPLGARLARARGDDLEPLLYALVRGHRTHGRRAPGEPPDDLTTGGIYRAHPPQCALHLPGKQPRLDPTGQVRGPGGPRPRLFRGAGGADQGHQADHDDGGRKDRVPGGEVGRREAFGFPSARRTPDAGPTARLA